MPHSLPQLRGPVPDTLGLCGLFATALLAGSYWHGFLAAMAVLGLATLLDLHRAWPLLRRQPLFWLAVALTAYILVHTPLAVRDFPMLAQNTFPDWTDLLAISGLLSVIAGYWLARNLRLYPQLLAVTAVGIVIGLAMGIEWQNLWVRGLGVRRDWGYVPEQVGLLSAMGFLGCVVLFLRRLADRRHTNVGRALRALPWFLAALAFAIVLYGTQTRATWIAAAALSLVYLGWHLGISLRQRQGLRSGIAALCLLAISLAALVQIDGGERLERRMGGGPDTVAALVMLDREGVYRSNPSLGVRLNMWTEAMRAFTQRPILGWGIGAKVVTDAQAQLDVGWRQPQYHNLYVEFLLGLGLLGFGLFMAICALLIRPLVPLPRNHAETIAGHGPPAPSRTILALCAALTAFAVLFELQVGHPYSRAMVIWLMALLAGMALHNNTGTGSDQRPPDVGPSRPDASSSLR